LFASVGSWRRNALSYLRNEGLADPTVNTELEKHMPIPATEHGSRYPKLEPAEVVIFGAFHFAGHVPVGEIAEFYGLPIPQAEKATPVGDFIAARLLAKPRVGDAIGIGMIGLVVHGVDGERITAVGLEL
jgi:Transporter associated domain